MLNDLNNSRRNRTDLRATTQEAKNFVRDLFSTYLAFRDHKQKRRLTEEQQFAFREHIEMVICDLLAAWHADPERFIGYSRGKRNFIKGGSYWSYKRNKSIPARAILFEIIEFLDALDLLENHIAAAGAGEFSSRMRASARLSDEFSNSNLNSFHLGNDPEYEVIVVKDEAKKIIPLEDAKGRKRCFDPTFPVGL
ncbi:hypothetical protein AAFN47_28015 [Hoeflea sp. CAU 1731]